MSSKIVRDPSDKLSPYLKWHLHLVSSHKCEDDGDVFSYSSEQIKDLLLNASREKDDKEKPCAWSWQRIDLPRNRTSMIVWQSPHLPEAQSASKNGDDEPIVVPPDRFPTDGFAWGDPEEEITKEQIGEYTLETYKHRSGFVPALTTWKRGQRPKKQYVHGIEQFTVHARTRYRLIKGSTAKGQEESLHNLWLVLYKRAERQHILPVASPAIQDVVSAQIDVLHKRDEVFGRIPTGAREIPVFDRGYDIKQKGFIWTERENWPNIEFKLEPLATNEVSFTHLGRGAQGNYMAGQQILNQRGQPSAKRARNNQGEVVERAAYIPPEGEDDGGRDVMDALTPREISINRYRQHTEWMEELFVSPFPLHLIRPVSIGLGRTGQLSRIGKSTDFVDIPSRLGQERAISRPTAEDYKKATEEAEKRIAEIKAEIEDEKALHQKRMAKIRQSGAIQEAERKLRSAVQFPPHASSKSERSEAIHAPGCQDVDVAMLRQIDDVKQIAQGVEASLGRKIEVVEQGRCISRGGLEEKAPTPPPQQDVNMEGTEEPQQGALAQVPAGDNTAQQALPVVPLAMTDEDFEMVDKNDLLDDSTMGGLGADASLPAAGLDDGIGGETGTPADDFSAQFLDIPDDHIGGTPADDFGPSAFDDAFDSAGGLDGDAGGNTEG